MPPPESASPVRRRRRSSPEPSPEPAPASVATPTTPRRARTAASSASRIASGMRNARSSCSSMRHLRRSGRVRTVARRAGSDKPRRPDGARAALGVALPMGLSGTGHGGLSGRGSRRSGSGGAHPVACQESGDGPFQLRHPLPDVRHLALQPRHALVEALLHLGDALVEPTLHLREALVRPRGCNAASETPAATIVSRVATASRGTHRACRPRPPAAGPTSSGLRPVPAPVNERQDTADAMLG